MQIEFTAKSEKLELRVLRVFIDPGNEESLMRSQNWWLHSGVIVPLCLRDDSCQSD